MTALDQRTLVEGVDDRSAQRLGPVDHHRDARLGLSPRSMRSSNSSLHADAFSVVPSLKPQNRRTHLECRQHHMLREVHPIEQRGEQLEPAHVLPRTLPASAHSAKSAGASRAPLLIVHIVHRIATYARLQLMLHERRSRQYHCVPQRRAGLETAIAAVPAGFALFVLPILLMAAFLLFGNPSFDRTRCIASQCRELKTFLLGSPLRKNTRPPA